MSISKITLKQQIDFINDKVIHHSEEAIRLKRFHKERVERYIEAGIWNLTDPKVKANADHMEMMNANRIKYHRKKANMYKAILRTLKTSIQPKIEL